MIAVLRTGGTRHAELILPPREAGTATIGRTTSNEKHRSEQAFAFNIESMGTNLPYTAFTFKHSIDGKNDLTDPSIYVLTIARGIAEAATLAQECLPVSELALLSYGTDDLATARLFDLKNGEARIIRKLM